MTQKVQLANVELLRKFALYLYLNASRIESENHAAMYPDGVFIRDTQDIHDGFARRAVDGFLASL